MGSAIESGQSQLDSLIYNQLQDKDDFKDRIKNLFRFLDIDSSGGITEEELRECFKDESVRAYFAALKLEADDPDTMFKLLYVKCAGQLDLCAFVKGCMRLRGNATGMDLAQLSALAEKTYLDLNTLRVGLERSGCDVLNGRSFSSSEQVLLQQQNRQGLHDHCEQAGGHPLHTETRAGISGTLKETTRLADWQALPPECTDLDNRFPDRHKTKALEKSDVCGLHVHRSRFRRCENKPGFSDTMSINTQVKKDICTRAKSKSLPMLPMQIDLDEIDSDSVGSTHRDGCLTCTSISV